MLQTNDSSFSGICFYFNISISCSILVLFHHTSTRTSHCLKHFVGQLNTEVPILLARDGMMHLQKQLFSFP